MRARDSLVLCVMIVGCVSAPGVPDPDEDPGVKASGDDRPWEETIAPDVLKVMRRQEALEPAVSLLYEQQMKLPGSGFAGIAFEGDGLALYYKGELPPAMASALAQARAIGDVQVKPAAFSAAELEADGAAIEAARAAHGATDLQAVVFRNDGSGIDIERLPPDAVAGMAASRAQHGKAALTPVEDLLREARVAAPVRITVADAVVEAGASRFADTKPWNGGGYWETWHDTNHDGNGDVFAGACTTGFGVVASGRTWILTAAHCASLGDIAYHGSARVKMGPINSDQWAYDLLLIDTSGWYLIFDGSPTTSNTKQVKSWGYHATNELLCQSGVTSGTVCGIKTGSSTNVTMGCCDSDGDSGYTVYGMIGTSQVDGQISFRHGDSGAPVFSLDGAGVRAKGIACLNPDTSHMYFQDWADAIRLFGAYPRTGP